MLSSYCGSTLAESYHQESNITDSNWLRWLSSLFFIKMRLSLWCHQLANLQLECLWNKKRNLTIVHSIFFLYKPLVYVEWRRQERCNWRLQWKKGVRFFTQKWTLSKTFQISHAVLFRCVKQCSACVCPKFASFLRYYVCKKTHFSKGILWGPFVECKTKETFCFAERWSHYNTLISYYCFVSASGWGA